MAGLTSDQRELWDELALDVPDDEEGRKGLIESFRAACRFDGVAVPDVEAVQAAIDGTDHGEFGAERPPEGAYIDLPFESGSADPQPLQYEDLGEGKRYTG